MRDAERKQLGPDDFERLPVHELAKPEHPLEHVVETAETDGEVGEPGTPAGRRDQLRPLGHGARTGKRPPDPRHEVARVVEVEMRDRDRVDIGPLVLQP